MTRRILHLALVLLAGLCASGEVLAQPANDACGGAQLIVPNGTCYSGTTVAAGDNWIGTVGCAGNNAEVWYTFVATGSVAHFQVTSGTLGGNVEIILVSSTGPCNGLGLEGSVCAPSPVNLDVSFSLVVGNTYYYTISGSGAPGTFTTCVTTANTPPAPGLDCTTAEALCNGGSFSQGNFTGIGATEEISQNSCFGLDERQSKWYTFTCSQSGTFQLLVNPTNYVAASQTGDDFDFSLWNITSGCYVSANILPVPISCNWSGCVGSTGIAPAAPFMAQVAGTDYENNNPPGPGDCLSNQQWNTTAVSLVACQRYALLIDNYTTSSGGFSVSFAGTAVIGPRADFTSVLDATCMKVTVSRGPWCTGPQMTYQWNFGDGYTTTTAVPAQHTYASTGAYTVSLTVTDANGCVDNYSQLVDVGCTFLPIQLIAFKATQVGDAVRLDWTTASEQDNERFIVERTTDGETFETVGSLPGAGRSTQAVRYALDDAEPLQGLGYYRLKQIDANGTYTYSDLVSVEFKRITADLPVFPVPARDHLLFSVNIPADAAVQLIVLDVFGRALINEKRALTQGASTVQVETHSLASGTYVLHVITAAEDHTARFIIE